MESQDNHWGIGVLSVLGPLLPMLGQAEPAASGSSWLADPRSAVLVILASIVILGGGRRLYLSAKARRAVARLAEPDVSAAEVASAAEHGREGLLELFRLLSEAKAPEVREAAGKALATLWGRDELIPEEEQAVVRRGYSVHWQARRKYPRAIRGPIPILVEYGVPALKSSNKGEAPRHPPQAEGDEVPAGSLEWSHRVAGSGRASLESFSDWRPGPSAAGFTIDPEDFDSNGPHRLVLQTKVRTSKDLSSTWEIELPHMAFPFEFDPRLEIDALLSLPDDARGSAIAEAIRLVSPEPSEENPRFLDLPGDFVLRDPPVLVLTTPLPCDLAQTMEVEFEGVPGRFRAGAVVLSGQGMRAEGPVSTQTIPIGPIEGLPPGTIERPGEVRLRVILKADPNLGWADPEIRSIWPEPIETTWAPARVIRR
ncbi:hypothetical protein BH23PLA1_BH23PLA1_31890 [soil metagenome]